MRGYRLWGTFLLMGGLWVARLPMAMAALPDFVRVRLFEAYPGIQSIQVSGQAQLVFPVNQTFRGGQLRIVRQPGGLLIQDGNANRVLYRAQRFRLKALHGNLGLLPVGSALKQPRRYEGTLDFEAQAGALKVWNRLPARDYVATVIGSETPPDWPLEALKAQAVLTQSRLSRYRPDDELGDSTQQEAFLGAAYHRADTHRPVMAVWGQTLAYQGRTVTPYYHASCAGHTSDGAFFANGQAMPWLSAVRCPYCQKAPFFKPTVSYVPLTAFQSTFWGKTPLVMAWDNASRPLQMRAGKTSLSGYQFWIRLGQRFGWDKAPGTRFQLQRDGQQVRITSAGAGHGVGLCQWGAAAMAKQGKSYQDILKFYFPRASLSR